LLAPPAIASVWRSRQSKLITTYGSARWATNDEVEGAGQRLSAVEPIPWHRLRPNTNTTREGPAYAGLAENYVRYGGAIRYGRSWPN